MCFLTSPKFCYSRFGWNSRKTEETLQPVLKQLSTQQVKISYSTDLYISQCLTIKTNEIHQNHTLFIRTLHGHACTNMSLTLCSAGEQFIDGVTHKKARVSFSWFYSCVRASNVWVQSCGPGDTPDTAFSRLLMTLEMNYHQWCPEMSLDLCQFSCTSDRLQPALHDQP